MGTTELAMKRAELISNVYGRAYAAAISCNDNGILAEAEAKKAVVGYIRMMKVLDSAFWYGVDEEAI